MEDSGTVGICVEQLSGVLSEDLVIKLTPVAASAGKEIISGS